MIRSRRKWIVILLACLPALVLLGLSLGQTRAQSTAPVWARVDAGLPGTYNLNSVYLLNGTDNAWVAGSTGDQGFTARLQRQGDGWTVLNTTQFPVALHAIVVITDDNVWAVGDKGVIVHRSGGQWTNMGVALAADLTTIQMFGKGEEGWAGGTVHTPGQLPAPVLLHYQNGTWQPAPALSGPGSINSLHFVGNSGWAVGQVYDPDAHVEHFTGGGWQPQPSGLCPSSNLCYTELTGVRVLSADNAWAVGIGGPGHGPPARGPIILHWTGAQWENLPADSLVHVPGMQASWLNGVSFSDATHGLAVGGLRVGQTMTGPVYPFVLSYQPDGAWHTDSLPYVQGELRAVSQADATHALAVGDGGLILAYGYGGSAPAPWPTTTPYYQTPPTPEPTPWPPTQPAPDPKLPNVLYFPVVQHSLQGGFRAYWEAHGGLAQFGYPLTEEYQATYNGHVYTTQYFERARFEWHPENRAPYDILLGLLGNELTVTRQKEAPFGPHAAQPGAGGIYFPETRHNMAPQFVAYWQSHGGLPVYGYPISEPFTETSATDGKPYLVQYFERNRFEYHPELPDAYRVSLGLLGVDQLRGLGWIAAP